MEDTVKFISQLDLNKGKYYKKRYSINKIGNSTTTVGIPPAVIEKKAEEKGMTSDEFVKKYQLVAIYNGFDGVFYTFEERKYKKKTRKKINDSKESD